MVVLGFSQVLFQFLDVIDDVWYELLMNGRFFIEILRIISQSCVVLVELHFRLAFKKQMLQMHHIF